MHGMENVKNPFNWFMCRWHGAAPYAIVSRTFFFGASTKVINIWYPEKPLTLRAFTDQKKLIAAMASRLRIPLKGGGGN
jgi:hypothetical protein